MRPRRDDKRITILPIIKGSLKYQWFSQPMKLDPYTVTTCYSWNTWGVKKFITFPSVETSKEVPKIKFDFPVIQQGYIIGALARKSYRVFLRVLDPWSLFTRPMRSGCFLLCRLQHKENPRQTGVTASSDQWSGAIDLLRQFVNNRVILARSWEEMIV